jgi:hypothetical protein
LNRKLKIYRIREISEKIGDKSRKIGGKPGIFSNNSAKKWPEFSRRELLSTEPARVGSVQ